MVAEDEGSNALATILATKPDIALMEPRLTPQTGLEVMRAAQAEGCESKFVFMAQRPDSRPSTRRIDARVDHQARVDVTALVPGDAVELRGLPDPIRSLRH